MVQWFNSSCIRSEGEWFEYRHRPLSVRRDDSTKKELSEPRRVGKNWTHWPQ